MNRFHSLTIMLAFAPLSTCTAAAPLDELRQAAGGAAPAVPAVGEPQAVAAPLPELPPSDGMWWQKGGFALKALEALAARTEADLAKLPQALEKETPDAPALAAELDSLAAAYGQVRGWHFPYGGDFRRYGMSCVRQGPWSDQIWYVTEYWQGPHWVEMDAIKDDLDTVAAALKTVADYAKKSLETPGPLSAEKTVTDQAYSTEEYVAHKFGPFKLKQTREVVTPVETPTAALLERSIARILEASANFSGVVRKVHAEGMTQVMRQWTEDSRYRPRDGEQPPVSKRDCPHNGVY